MTPASRLFLLAALGEHKISFMQLGTNILLAMTAARNGRRTVG